MIQARESSLSSILWTARRKTTNVHVSHWTLATILLLFNFFQFLTSSSLILTAIHNMKAITTLVSKSRSCSWRTSRVIIPVSMSTRASWPSFGRRHLSVWGFIGLGRMGGFLPTLSNFYGSEIWSYVTYQHASLTEYGFWQDIQWLKI